MDENSICKTSVTTEMNAEFSSPVSIKWSGSLNSFPKFPQCGTPGSQAQCSEVIWSSLISALRTIR